MRNVLVLLVVAAATVVAFGQDYNRNDLIVEATTAREERTVVVPTYQDFADRVFAYYQISAAAANDPDHPYRTGWGINRSDYAEFFAENVDPQIAAGVERFVLWNPYGLFGPGPMDYDAKVDAKERNFENVADFGDELRDVGEEHPGVVFHVYIGSLRDRYLMELFESDPAAWLFRLTESSPDLLLPNVDISFDHAQTYRYDPDDATADYPDTPAADDPRWRWTELLDSIKVNQKRRTYVEATPRRASTWQHSRSFSVLDDYFWRTRPGDDPVAWGSDRGITKHAPTTMIDGRILLLAGNSRVREVSGDGNYAAFLASRLSRSPQLEVAVPLHYYFFDRTPAGWVRNGRTMVGLYYETLDEIAALVVELRKSGHHVRVVESAPQ